jgi:hypothetical protein
MKIHWSFFYFLTFDKILPLFCSNNAKLLFTCSFPFSDLSFFINIILWDFIRHIKNHFFSFFILIIGIHNIVLNKIFQISETLHSFSQELLGFNLRYFFELIKLLLFINKFSEILIKLAVDIWSLMRVNLGDAV